MHSLLSFFTVSLEIIAIAGLADFLAGLIHWIEDAYFTEDTPVIGPRVIRPNIVHHHVPRYFTKLSWWESSKELVVAGLLVLGLAAWFHALTWQLWLFVIISANGNQVHKWAHRTRAENGRVISWLQDWRILQTPRQHGLHHSDPKNTYYCPITNFVNPILEKISFWDRLEKIIERLTGVTHRKDTAVRGQGPGPEWLIEFKPASRAVKLPAAAASVMPKPTLSAKRCPNDCAQCPARCGRVHRLAA